MESFGLITLSLLIISPFVIFYKKLSILKFLTLIILPPFLVAIYSVFINIFLQTSYSRLDDIFFVVLIFGSMFMVPSLLIYSLATTFYEKYYKPTSLKLTIVAAIIGAISSIVSIITIDFSLDIIIVTSISGSLSIFIVNMAIKFIKTKK